MPRVKAVSLLNMQTERQNSQKDAITFYQAFSEENKMNLKSFKVVSLVC